MHLNAIKCSFAVFLYQSVSKSVPNLGHPEFPALRSVRPHHIASRRGELVLIKFSRFAAHFQIRAGVVVFGSFCGEFLKLAVLKTSLSPGDLHFVHFLHTKSALFVKTASEDDVHSFVQKVHFFALFKYLHFLKSAAKVACCTRFNFLQSKKFSSFCEFFTTSLTRF